MDKRRKYTEFSRAVFEVQIISARRGVVRFYATAEVPRFTSVFVDARLTIRFHCVANGERGRACHRAPNTPACCLDLAMKLFVGVGIRQPFK